MENTEDFYLVLPSNSSMTYFPENTTTCFTTQLQREMRLVGEWMVGLAEIHIPCTIMHIRESEAAFTFNLGAEQALPSDFETQYIPHGVYESLEQLANEINKIPIVRDHQQLVPTEYQKGYYALSRTCSCKQPHYTRFSEKIRRIFGFTHHDDTFVTAPTSTSTNVGEEPASLARAIPDQLFIYTDICVPCMVGDTQAPLLRIVALENSKYRYGSNTVKHFAPIHYIPLLHHSFSNIIIDIRSQFGETISFTGMTLTVTLHFTRRR